jgi:hypothetical protein
MRPLPPRHVVGPQRYACSLTLDGCLAPRSSLRPIWATWIAESSPRFPAVPVELIPVEGCRCGPETTSAS